MHFHTHWKTLLVLATLFMLGSVFGGCDDDDDNDDNDDIDIDNDDDDDTSPADDDDDDDNNDDDDDDDDDDNNDNDNDDDDTFGVVVFTQFLDDRMDISKVTSPLGEVTKLVDVADHMSMFPALSPDGLTVAFGSNIHDPNPGINFATMLYTMPTAGGEPTRLTDENYLSVNENTPIYSPDGLTIAYVRCHQSDPPAQVDRIWLMDADGGNRGALHDDTEIRNDYNPAFSPDGQKLVYVSDGDVWCADVYLADLTVSPATRTRLTVSDCLTVQGNSQPFFDATGDWVYFESSRDDSYGLYRVPAAGGDPELRWDIGFSDDGPNLGMASYSMFRPTENRLGLVGSGAHDQTDRIYIFDTLDPIATPVPVTGADIDAVDPTWWKPVKR